jgi:hypothetical protein
MLREKNSQNDSILAVDFVKSDFFLNRIHGFEKKYDLRWDQFLAEYTTGRLHDACKNTDYAEWAFLCNNFMSELLRLNQESPPVQKSSSERQKPEADSGFFFLRRCFVRRPILFRDSRESPRNEPQPSDD